MPNGITNTSLSARSLRGSPFLPVLCKQEKKESTPSWSRIRKEILIKRIFTITNKMTKVFAKDTVEQNDISSSLNIEEIASKFPTLTGDKEKIEFLVYFYITLCEHFPFVYFFFR